jgi:hypothetical protein
VRCPFNGEYIFHILRTFTIQGEPGGVVSYRRINGKRTGFTCILIYVHVTGAVAYFRPDLPETLVSVDVYIAGFIHLFVILLN